MRQALSMALFEGICLLLILGFCEFHTWIVMMVISVAVICWYYRAAKQTSEVQHLANPPGEASIPGSIAAKPTTNARHHLPNPTGATSNNGSLVV